MLSYDLTSTDAPLYIELYNKIKNDIMSHKLTTDTKLPSKRSLAENLGVSVITVENAYAQLLAEGYIYSEPKRGFFVESISERLAPSMSNNMQRRLNTSEAVQDKSIPSTMIDFSSNAPSPEQFPFSIWAKLVRNVLTNEQELLLKPCPGQGLPTLREAIANHLASFRGMSVNPDNIIIGSGTEYLYGILIQLLGRDKTYGIEDPGYQKIAKVYKANTVSCKHIPLEKDGISISALNQEEVDIAHISPSHHFPTGIVTPVSKRLALLDWAGENENRYIIEDDYDSELRLSGKPIPSLQSIDTEGKVIYMNTFSKTLSSTIRISYMILPQKLADSYQEKLSFYACTVPSLDQYTLMHFINEGYFERHINRTRNYYRKKRDLLLSEISTSNLKDYINISEEDAGLHFLLTIKTNLSDETIIETLKNQGVKLSSISEYYATKKETTQKAKKQGKSDLFMSSPVNSHTFIINYSSLSENQIRKAINILEEVLIIK